MMIEVLRPRLQLAGGEGREGGGREWGTRRALFKKMLARDYESRTRRFSVIVCVFASFRSWSGGPNKGPGHSVAKSCSDLLIK